MIYIEKEEYDRRLKEFLKEQGPSGAQGMASSWAWHVQKEREFQKLLAEQGIAKQK